jgi:hypothetical protein
MKSANNPDAVNKLALGIETRQFIAASPGTYLLHYQRDLRNISVWRENVIGWSIGSSGIVDPVTFHGRKDSCVQTSIVLFPDGRVQDYDGLYDSYDAWFDELIDDGPPRPSKPSLRLVDSVPEETNR